MFKYSITFTFSTPASPITPGCDRFSGKQSASCKQDGMGVVSNCIMSVLTLVAVHAIDSPFHRAWILSTLLRQTQQNMWLIGSRLRSRSYPASKDSLHLVTRIEGTETTICER